MYVCKAITSLLLSVQRFMKLYTYCYSMSTRALSFMRGVIFLLCVWCGKRLLIIYYTGREMSHKRRVIPQNLPIRHVIYQLMHLSLSLRSISQSTKHIKIRDSISLHVKINIKSAVEWFLISFSRLRLLLSYVQYVDITTFL